MESHRELNKKIFELFLLFIYCTMLSLSVMAEPDESLRPGIIKGTILDESTQIPLPAATIMIDDTPLGAAADMEGQYFIERIPPGIYNVRFMMIGYETRVVNSVVVNPGLTTWLTVELKSTVLEMEGVSITAGFFQEAKDAVISNRSMDFEEIRMDPGSVGDIQRVVQALPSVVSGSDQDNEIIVRGGMPGENLFIMDHIEIPNPNHFASQGLGGGPINMINTEFVRRIDFYAGAFPARYGDKASSAMEISLREGSRDRITGHAYLGMAGVGAMIEGPIKNRGSYMFSARKSFLDLIISSTGLTAVPHYYSLQGKVVVDLNATNQLIWNGIFGDDEITIDEDEGGGYERGAENVKSESYQYATGITLRSLYGKKGFSRITLSQVANNWDQFVWESDGDPYFTNQSTEIERTLKADWTYQLSKRLEFSVGGHVKSIPFDIDIWADADTMFVFQPGTTQILSDSIIYPEYKRMEKETTLKTAGFLQVKWNPWDRLTLSMGLRGDHFKYTDKLSLDPRIGFSYAITEKTDLNFAVGQFSQSPAYVQITAHPGNNSLDYKSNRQIAGGFSRLFTEDMRGTVEVFYKDYFNVPISKASLTPNPFDASNGHLVNEGEGYAKGFEFFLQKKLTHQYHFTLSYAYSISKGRDPRNGEQFSWDYDYRQHFTFIGGAHYDLRNKEWYKSMKKHWLYDFFGWLVPLADQVEVGVRWRYLGGRPYSERTYHPEYRRWVVEPSTPFNGLRYPQYHRLDFRVDWRHMYNSWNMVAFLDIMNIYARDNIWMYSYNADGTVENVYQFQVFPVGGVSIEF